jgi:hypothetical protein
MKLYLICQNENDDYDSYDSAVVCAPSEDVARTLDPRRSDGQAYDFSKKYCRGFSHWCSSPDKVAVQLIGDAAPGMSLGVVCASFNAG